jgi:hypothetical protein
VSIGHSGGVGAGNRWKNVRAKTNFFSYRDDALSVQRIELERVVVHEDVLPDDWCRVVSRRDLIGRTVRLIETVSCFARRERSCPLE